VKINPHQTLHLVNQYKFHCIPLTIAFYRDL
jgi:hypothetical protein